MRPREAEARASDLGVPRGSEPGKLAGRRGGDVEKEGRVAGAAGTAEGVGGGGRSLRAACAALRWSARPAGLGSAESACRQAVASAPAAAVGFPILPARLGLG